MEEEPETVEDILNFDAIGNWRTIKNDDNKYEQVFVPGVDVQHVLRTILREIREENEEYRDYSVKMKKYAIPETRLVPLFVSSGDNEDIMMVLLKIFVCYTLPLKRDDSCYNDLHMGLLRFLEAFLANSGLSSLLNLVSEAIGADFFDRDKHQTQQIELTMTFIRNLCCIENLVEDKKSSYSHIHETLVKCMYDELIIESLTILSVEEQSSYHWMILEIFCLILSGANPKDVYNSTQQQKGGISSLRSLLNNEIEKSKHYERQLPSSFSGSYDITSVNRLISQNHRVEDYSYKPRTYIPRRAKKYIFNNTTPQLNTYIRPLYSAMIFIINTCYNDYITILQKQMKKRKDLLPVDYQNYLTFTSFCNRFAALFIVDKRDELTVDSISATTTQDFLVYCLDLCKKLHVEEIQWNSVTPVFENISALFDIFCGLLNRTGEEWDVIKYKTEMIVNAVMTQVSYIQLLPDVLVKWKPKDGFAPFFALIMSIDSLLQICDKIRERGLTLLKRKHARTATTAESAERGEEVTTIEYTEVSFSLHFLTGLLYRPVVMDKYDNVSILSLDISIFSITTNN